MLTEYTTPGESVEVRDDESIYSLLTGRIARTGEDTVIAETQNRPRPMDEGHYRRIPQCRARRRKRLIAFGINKGDAVTIFSTTRYEWGVLDFALAAIGAVNVPIYDTDSAAQAERILNDSDVKLAIADNRERFDRLDSVIDRCPSLKHILMLDSNAMGALEGLGVTVSDEELEARIDSVHADDLPPSCTRPVRRELQRVPSFRTAISYRSRAQAVWRCMRSFSKIIRDCFSSCRSPTVSHGSSSTRRLLPTTAWLVICRTQRRCCPICVPSNRPICWAYHECSRRCITRPPARPARGWKGRLFLKAAEAARDWSRMQQAGERPTAKQIAQHLSYEASVYRTVRSALGPRIRYVACGGAPLDVSLAHFFNGIGLPMIQGYGMTETAAPFAATRVTDNVIGTVGQPAPGSSVRISDDGELQVKGPNVFRGYHNLPEKTAEAFTEDGWLKTGDLASIDDEGRITITGRKKDIIITAGGKNVSPIPMEQEIVKCPIVEHVVVVGDNRPFIGALITLDPEGLEAWLPSIGLSADTPLDRVAATAAVHDEIQKYIDKANATVSRAESVRKFVVLDTQFTQENKCLTPSLKVVRPAVNRVFRTGDRSAAVLRQALNRIIHESVGYERTFCILSYPTLLFCLYNFQGMQTSAGDRKRSDPPALIWQRLVMNPECLTTLHQPLSVKRQSVTVPSVHNACG